MTVFFYNEIQTETGGCLSSNIINGTHMYAAGESTPHVKMASPTYCIFFFVFLQPPGTIIP